MFQIKRKKDNYITIFYKKFNNRADAYDFIEKSEAMQDDINDGYEFIIEEVE